jgi:glycosyltransferase involved in cell wall biosynthesis
MPPAWLLSDAPYAGGAERYLHWHLQAAGRDRLGLIAVDGPGLRGWIAEQEADGFAVRRIAPGSLHQRWQQLRAVLLTLRPRLLHVNLPGPYDGMMAAAPLVARLAGVPRVVVTEHLPSVGRVGKRYWLKRAAVPAIHRAIAVCEIHAAVLRRVFGYRETQVSAIPNGVPDPNPHGVIAAQQRRLLPGDLAARERHGGCRIVQVGALDARKGGDLLIDAAEILQRDGVPFTCWLVGEGEERERWEARIAGRGVGDRVQLAGRRDDVHAILSACDVVVLASRREGMPLSLLEAMAHGLPVVATAVDGIPEIVASGRSGLLVEPDDPRALSWALAELARSPLRREQYGRAARAMFLARHTLARMTSATFSEYGAWFGEVGAVEGAGEAARGVA